MQACVSPSLCLQLCAEILTESLTLNQSPAEAQSLWHSPGCQGTHLTVYLCIGCAFLTECWQLATSEFHPWLPTPETSPACFMERASRCGSSSAAPPYAVMLLPFVCRLFKFKGTDGSKFLPRPSSNSHVPQYPYLSTFFFLGLSSRLPDFSTALQWPLNQRRECSSVFGGNQHLLGNWTELKWSQGDCPACPNSHIPLRLSFQLSPLVILVQSQLSVLPP